MCKLSRLKNCKSITLVLDEVNRIQCHCCQCYGMILSRRPAILPLHLAAIDTLL